VQAAELFDDETPAPPPAPLEVSATPPALPPLRCPRCGGRCRWEPEPDEPARADAAAYGWWRTPGIWTQEDHAVGRGAYGCATSCPYPRCNAPLALALRVRVHSPFAPPPASACHPLLDQEGYCRLTEIDSAELVALPEFLERHRARDLRPPTEHVIAGSLRAALGAFLAFLPAFGCVLIFNRQTSLRGPYPDVFWPSCALAALAALYASLLPRRLQRRRAHRRALVRQAASGEGAVVLRRDDAANGYR
jgi:hypothetical protein